MFDGFARQLARFADHDETAAHPERQGSGDEEAARFDADQKIGAVRRDHVGKLLDGLGPGAGVRQQRRYVVEQNSRFWKIGNFSDMILQSYRHEAIAAMALNECPVYCVASFR